MKVTLHFNLPEEKSEYVLVNKSSDMYCILWNFDQWLRSEIKYGSDKFTPDERDVLDKVRKKLYEIFDDYNFRWDDYNFRRSE